MKKLILLTPLLLLPISCSTQDNQWISKAEEVSDGDTIKVDGTSIRLFGVDTPELHNQYSEFEETEGIEKLYALQAKKFTQKFVSRTKIIIKTITKDKYGRVVAKVNNGSDLGIALLRAGLARVAFISVTPGNPFITSDYDYYKELLNAQHEAYIKEIGVWAHKDLYKTIFPKG